MIRTKLMAFAIAALSLGAAACGSDGESTGPAPTEESGTITLLNESSTALVTINIARCSDPDWGPNRLAASETVATGAMRSWSLEPDCYDVKASNGTRFATWYDLDVDAGDTVRVAAPAGLDASIASTSTAAR